MLLRRPAGAPAYDEQTLERIQGEHVDFYASLRAAGQVVTNGPVVDQADESLRGIAIFAVESVARATDLASNDPAVAAGRLAVEAMTWWCPPHTMTVNGIPITIDT